VLHVQGYNVYRSIVSGSGYAKVNSSPIKTAHFTDTGLANGTAYYYVVSTVDTVSLAGRESAGFSNEAFGVPTSPPSSGGGCLLTRLYGDPNDPHLPPLRLIRDQIRAEMPGGAKLVELYYKVGPSIWERLKNSPIVRKGIVACSNLFLVIWWSSWGIKFLLFFPLNWGVWKMWRRLSCYQMERCGHAWGFYVRLRPRSYLNR
jgi:hypothetical protein